MRTRLQAAADRTSDAIRRSVGEQFQHLREDAGLSKADVARAAGIDPTHLGYIEAGQRAASIAVLSRVSRALGADLSLRVYPNTGPLLRDRHQARMIEAFLSVLPEAWERHLEVPVYRPVRGVIDAVIAHPPTGRVVSVEAHSELRRLEQQLRWAAEKTDALPSAAIWPAIVSGERQMAMSRILLLRSTHASRALVRTFASTIASAYPADPTQLWRALMDPGVNWPGSGILWLHVHGSSASIIQGVPRGVRIRP